MSNSTRQQQILNAMGIDQWVSKDQLEVISGPVAQQVITPQAPPAQTTSPAATEVKSTEQLHVIPGRVHPSEVKESAPEPIAEKPLTYSPPDPQKIAELEWAELEQVISVCGGCELHQGRTQTVFGTGSQTANWLIIGEAPGQEEDIQGESFVGRAGQLLNNMLIAVGQLRDQVYMTNVVKCSPPGNRDPKDDETIACQSYLKRQVALIKPKMVLVVGRIAAQSLLATTTPVGKLRGKVYQFPDTNIPMVVTYHPSYLLRRPSEKAKSWQDLKLAMAAYNEL